jgi:hypothetical protein
MIDINGVVKKGLSSHAGEALGRASASDDDAVQEVPTRGAAPV